MRDIQNRVWKFCEDYKLNEHPKERLINLLSNFDKHSMSIIILSEHGANPDKYSDEIKSEFGELLLGLINSANTLNVDLHEALDLVLKKKSKK
ncbi:MAG: hypothetical protein AABW73_01825 [Nanoarchaeota archaeon]